MQTILYIDPVAGISGDMFLGALVDIGVDFEALSAALKKLDVPGFSLRKTAVFRHSIAATKVDVVVEDVEHPHRHLDDLLDIVGEAALPERVKEDASAVLTRLAEAESRVHRMPIEHVHLHEVGGLDCLVDVVGTVYGLHLLGIEDIYSGPVTLGTGIAACAHGNMPVPVPGALALLEGFPVRKTCLNGEMTTPTGAALVTTLASGIVEPLVMVPRKIGYGAGTRDPEGIANMLRLVIAEVDPKLLPGHFHADHEHHHEDDHDHGHHHHEHDHGHRHEHHHPHPHGH